KTTNKSTGKSMKITIKLFATLRDFGPDIQEKSVPENSSVASVIDSLSLPGDIPLLKIVNGVHTDPEEKLKDGDVLALFPPVGGG
ncbi:MoaD/ThiS family protein, partial [Thermodesulfobacteriota bacterium]